MPATKDPPMTRNRKADSNGKPDDGEQLDLIEIEPENAKAIARVARAYKKAQAARMTALAEELKQKEKLLDVVHEANLAVDDDGKYRFRAGGTIITVTPRDELVQVAFDKDDAGNGSEGAPG